MTEIKLTLDDPHSTIASLREGASDLAPFGQKQVYEVVRQIEEQVKPAIEEPTEFGSVVMARATHPEWDLWSSAHWVNVGARWICETEYWTATWKGLRDVEVLRDGIGEAQ